MKITMKKIRRHKWLMWFIFKDVIFEIENDDGKIYEQPMCNGWQLETKEGNRGYDVTVKY